MSRRFLRTAEVAAAVGVHPNTVRMYEAWGLLQEIPRTPAGYRQFTQAHVDQMRLARKVYEGQWPGRPIHQAAVAVVKQSASGDFGGALEGAYGLLSVIQGEQAEAENAILFLQRWVSGTAADGTSRTLRIGDAASLLGVTTDVLRNWERDGLVRVPRDSHNRYRRYGAVEIGRLRVTRMLRRAGYSTMAILRMLLALDEGGTADLRQALDTPRPDEDAYSAADRWLSALTEWEQRAHAMIALLEAMITTQRA